MQTPFLSQPNPLLCGCGWPVQTVERFSRATAYACFNPSCAAYREVYHIPLTPVMGEYKGKLLPPQEEPLPSINPESPPLDTQA